MGMQDASSIPIHHTCVGLLPCVAIRLWRASDFRHRPVLKIVTHSLYPEAEVEYNFAQNNPVNSNLFDCFIQSMLEDGFARDVLYTMRLYEETILPHLDVGKTIIAETCLYVQTDIGWLLMYDRFVNTPPQY